MHAILAHGMGRTPLSMWRLASRLTLAGMTPHRFGYIAAFESFEHCRSRLDRFIEQRVGTEPYVAIGHSLGSVLLRSITTRDHQPSACFFLAPPTVACRAARYLRKNMIFRRCTGEMGQLLADAGFMEKVPLPASPVVVYVGTAGFYGQWSPFKMKQNDGLLLASETVLSVGRREFIDASHTFIMHHPKVASDIIATLRQLKTPVP